MSTVVYICFFFHRFNCLTVIWEVSTSAELTAAFPGESSLNIESTGATRRPRYGGRKEGTTQIRLDFVTQFDWLGKGPVDYQHWCSTDVCCCCYSPKRPFLKILFAVVDLIVVLLHSRGRVE